MSVAAVLHDLRVYSRAVVPDENLEVRGGVLELNLDTAGVGMPERIDQRLSTDSIDFVAQQRMEAALLTIDNDAKVDVFRRKRTEFLADHRKCVSEIQRCAFGRA